MILTQLLQDERNERREEPMQESRQQPEEEEKSAHNIKNNKGFQERQDDRRQNRDRNQRNNRDFNRKDKPNHDAARREQQIDPNSNFRLYYIDDPQFYRIVIRREEPPYEFKIHMFLDKKGEQLDRSAEDELVKKLSEKLETFGAKNINFRLLKDRSDKPNANDKMRFLFVIETQESALQCYDYFIKRFYKQKDFKINDMELTDDDLGIKQSIMIYLQKDEDVFVKYGDEEAKLYYEMEEMRKQEEAMRREQMGDRRDRNDKRNNDRNRKDKRDKREYNDQISAEDAKGLAAFRSSQPSHKVVQQRQVIDEEQKHSKTDNLRDIINEEKDKEQNQHGRSSNYNPKPRQGRGRGQNRDENHKYS